MQLRGDEAAIRAAPVPPGWDEPVNLEADPATIPDLAEVEVPEELLREIEAYMARYPDRHSATLPALAAAQRLHGWCSPLAVHQVAAVMRVTPAYLSSVATFYDMLRTRPTGSRYVFVCTSVACHLLNAKGVFDAIAAEATAQGLEDVEVREFECLGACDMAPMASIDGRFVGPLSVADAPGLVSEIKEGRVALPGRSLEDPGYRVPAGTGTGEGPAEHPDVAPAGGTVKEAEEVPSDAEVSSGHGRDRGAGEVGAG
ncbi:MAG TPA: NAD(P)H-dependent oxidoreductase subunit E [Thermoleophilaceae bacterium]|nr:NAD(P)H-dependent oxidoreductase subunit E [Thermoleophilaceae bacterium]